MPGCDIILPIYNGLTYLDHCLQSILSHTDDIDYRLYLIDDASDAFTHDYLQHKAAADERLSLHRNAVNLGFVQTCNKGISLGSSPFVVLINSDVIVTPGWLRRLLECANSDPDIASVNPLTNHAAVIHLPLKPGLSFLAMDRYLEQHSPKTFPDVVTGVGFCMLLRRQALQRVGLFDEIYGRGYCEESDLCMRLTQHSYRTVVADHVYVYHKGRGTFTDRDEHYRQNRRIFDQRWGDDYRRQYRAFRKADPLRPVRELFTLRKRWEPMPIIWHTGRALLDRWRRREWLKLGQAALRGLWWLPQAKREMITNAELNRYALPGRLRVTYVVNKLLVAGGILSVIQLVNELILLGVEARIVALFEDPAVLDWLPLLTQPIIYRTPEELIHHFPQSDIAVATLYATAPWVSAVVNQGRARTGVYFVQDYEPWFFPAHDIKSRQDVLRHYHHIPHRIVKSTWLQQRLAQDGLTAEKILLGMNLATFYPRDARTAQLSVIAMARPQTPRRGFQATVDALALVKQALPEIEIVLFGDNFLSSYQLPFVFTDAGVVDKQQRLAELYSQATVFLDGSEFQGFGRCALEAMACGTACVVTGVGGVTEYANNGVNCTVVPPKRPDLFAAAIVELLQNKKLRQQYSAQGHATAQRYCHRREARQTLTYFRSLTAGQCR